MIYDFDFIVQFTFSFLVAFLRILSEALFSIYFLWHFGKRKSTLSSSALLLLGLSEFGKILYILYAYFLYVAFQSFYFKSEFENFGVLSWIGYTVSFVLAIIFFIMSYNVRNKLTRKNNMVMFVITAFAGTYYLCFFVFSVINSIKYKAFYVNLSDLVFCLTVMMIGIAYIKFDNLYFIDVIGLDDFGFIRKKKDRIEYNKSREENKEEADALSNNIDTSDFTTEPAKSMFCRKCGARLDEDSAFCKICGMKVITVTDFEFVDTNS